jgi:hypothetical protein
MTLSPQAKKVVRWLWLAVGSFVAFFFLLFTGTWAAASLARAEDTFQARFDEPVERLVIDAAVGASIEVIGTQGDEVVVDGTSYRALASPAHVEELDGETLRLESDCDSAGPFAVAMFCTVDWVVQVPADVDVRVEGVGATVTVTGIDGTVDVEALAGSVELDDVSGSVEVETDGGGVQGTALRSPSVVADSSGGGIDLAFLTAPDVVSIGTSGGSTNVELPADGEAYAVDASASGGAEVIDISTDPDADRLLRLRTSGGGITVRYGAEGAP